MPEEDDEKATALPTSGNTSTSPRTIAVEANLLRLPLFALHTKGLRSLDGFECRGRISRNGQTREFLFRTARSTATMYPGPLSRSAHLAFLSLVTEMGLPMRNPITWTWYDLCQRIGSSPSGRTIQRLKKAIEATAGLTLFSQDAVYSKPEGQPLQTRQATHLYDTVIFVNEPLPDGGVADTNHLWLSSWYLDNVNALFTAPLDHELWRFLDKQSPIASRLYELLLINFFNKAPQFRINYGRLAQLLPMRPERYLSDAQRQLDPAFALLRQVRLTGAIDWRERTGEIAQLHFNRGDRLERGARVSRGELFIRPDKPAELLAVTEVRRPAAEVIVAEFYRLWTGETPSRLRPKELDLANQLMSRYGKSRLKALLPVVIEQLKKHWPGARTFLAVESYIQGAAGQFDQRERQQKSRQQQLRQWRTDEQQMLQRDAERKQFEAVWLPVWEQLPPDEQESIRRQVLEEQPMFRHAPGILQSKCLTELARRRETQDGIAPQSGAA